VRVVEGKMEIDSLMIFVLSFVDFFVPSDEVVRRNGTFYSMMRCQMIGEIFVSLLIFFGIKQIKNNI
jgi:hypothetical protein